MSDSTERLIHVKRRRPVWSTNQAITLCGNRSFEGDMSAPEMIAHVKKHARGSLTVAAATCCVTCLKVLPRGRQLANYDSDDIAIVLEYLTRIENQRMADQRARAQAELMAIKALVLNHYDEYQATVNRLMLSGKKPELKIVRTEEST